MARKRSRPLTDRRKPAATEKEAATEDVAAEVRREKKSPPVEESLHDWVTELAVQACEDSTSKDERKAKREAKKARRKERRSQKGEAKKTEKAESRSNNNHDDDENDVDMEARNRRLRALVERVEDAMDGVHCEELARRRERRKAREGFRFLHSDKVLHKRRQWDESGVQPRPRDYGGLGLARPSLFLALEDPATLSKLEEEFAEHIPGFFGKQRTKAMKKQLNANMLWKRLLEEKQQQQTQQSTDASGKKKKAKTLSDEDRLRRL